MLEFEAFGRLATYVTDPVLATWSFSIGGVAVAEIAIELPTDMNHQWNLRALLLLHDGFSGPDWRFLKSYATFEYHRGADFYRQGIEVAYDEIYVEESAEFNLDFQWDVADPGNSMAVQGAFLRIISTT